MDREFVFSHPEVQALIREKFIPLAMDDWYLRRQNDAYGKFFIEMTKPSPRGNAGDNTRQGRYVFTASGKFLGFNNNRSPERILSMLRDSLAKWDALPSAEKQPPGGTGDLSREARYLRIPPVDGAVVKVFTRVLERTKEGKFTKVTPPESAPGDLRHRGFDAATDHLWLNAADLKTLLPPPDAKPGTTIPVPRALAQRIARYHFVDSTRGEPPHWKRDEAKTVTLTLTVESAKRAKLVGRVHMETSDGTRGYIATLDGWLEHDRGKLTALHAVATGDHWGDSPLTAGARLGKSPLGVAFALCPDPKGADSIPPQGARWLDGYYDPDRN